MGVGGLGVAVRDPSPVLKLAEQAPDAAALAVLHSIVRCGVAAVAFGGDDRLDLGIGQLLADSVGVVAFVGEQGSIRSVNMRMSGPKPRTSCACSGVSTKASGRP